VLHFPPPEEPKFDLTICHRCPQPRSHPASRGTRRSEPDHVHRFPDRIGILAGVAVDGAQDRLHGRSQQALRRSNALGSDDVLVEPNPGGDFGQVGVAADDLDELVAGA